MSMTSGQVEASTGGTPRLHVVTREDRVAEFAGLRLLLASLQRFSPDIKVSAYLLSDHIAAEGDRLKGIHPGVRLVPMDEVNGWACKPAVLLDALAQEAGDDGMVLWVDTDIMVLRDISALAQTPPDLVLVAEESNPNDNSEIARRQTYLGLPVGTARASTISSAVVGVRHRHSAMVEAWRRGVESPEFKKQQQLPHHQRLLFGDQEVWEAVVCTPRFDQVGVRFLRNFNEMLQATYTSHVTRHQMQQETEPYFVHATGNLKPWRASRARLTQEVFPFFDTAREYLPVLAPEFSPAFARKSASATLIKAILGFRGYTHLRRMLYRIMMLRRR
jgi:hypothetical protein